jgi:hypothetical protein
LAVVSVLRECPHGTVVVHGGAVGADRIAHEFCEDNGMWTIPIPYFHHLGKRGGYMRNTVMADLLVSLAKHGDYEPRVEAFDLGTPGTAMMCDIAKRYGFHVRRHTP